MFNIWTEQNLRALQLVIDEHKPPREACKEVGISYHAIYTLLSRARLKYFFMTRETILLKEIRTDAHHLIWSSFRDKWKTRHIYPPLIRDIYVLSPSFLDQINQFAKDAKLGNKEFYPAGKMKTVTWRCPKCSRTQQVLTNNMVCSLC